MVILVDLSAHYASLQTQGLQKFIEKHLATELSVNSSDIHSILCDKELVISLNKRDLLDSSQLETLGELLNRTETIGSVEKATVNVISCKNATVNDLNPLLDQLKLKIESLYGVIFNLL